MEQVGVRSITARTAYSYMVYIHTFIITVLLILIEK